MKIDVKISIPDDGFLFGLQEVLKIIECINQCDENEVTIVFHEKTFVTPIFILPLLVYEKGCNKKLIYDNKNSYLNTICFSNGGLKSDSFDSPMRFSEKMKSYSKKTFIPIINFSTDNEFTTERNMILTAIENMIASRLNLRHNITYGLKYIVEECVDNIIEHSESERGYIFGQFYPKKKFLDICIADNGITLLGSYRKMPSNVYTDDLSAMQAANRGISTKNLSAAENRGFGIVTSKKMLIDGLNGYYVMLSGSALHLKNRKVDKYLLLPAHIKWQGTIIAIRIPYVDNNNFRYIDFVE